MFEPDNQDQQSHNDQTTSFAPPGMAPVVDHSLPMVTPDPGSDYGAPAPNFGASAPVVPDPMAGNTNSPNNTDDDLLDIKQQALQQLGPLVGHLEQTPEEKFRTTMMMIQASDDQNLIKDAYDAALAITDEKARAQALLDIVNEINYFTQQQK